MDRPLDESRARGMGVLLRLLAFTGLIVVCSADPTHAQPVCTDSYTGADMNGDANDPKNWSAGVPSANSDVCTAPTATGTVAFTGALTIHSLSIGNGLFASAYGSGSVTTTLTVTDTMTVEDHAGFAFGAADTSNPTVTLCVGGTMRVDGTVIANGGFSFRPVNPVLKVTDGHVFGAFQASQGTTTQLNGKLRLEAGSTAGSHGAIWPLGCPETPVPTTRRSLAASVQCEDEGTLSMAPGAYQISVDISGILDLTDSSGPRTVDGYSQDAGGTTKLALTGGSAISEIMATGNAALGGALEVDASGDITPHGGDMFTVIDAAAVTGTYSDLTVVNACQGQSYSLIYTPTKVMLAVGGDCPTPTPSPTPTQIPTTTPTPTPSPSAAPTANSTDTPTITQPPIATQTPTRTVPPTQSSTHTPTTTPLVLPSITATHTPTSTPTATATATPTPTLVSCVGDCNNNGTVSIDELITMVNIALGGKPPSACPKGLDKMPVSIDEIISAVGNALGGCRR
jgi:hypothetical protein